MIQKKRAGALWVACLLSLAAPPLAAPAKQASTQAGVGQPELLRQASETFNQIARKAVPAVVSVSSIRRGPEPASSVGILPFGGEDPSEAMMGLGSGIIIRSDGIVLTNFHVVDHAEKVTIQFSGDEKTKYQAKVLGTDEKTDLAVLRVLNPPNRQLATLSFGNSDTLEVGDWALAVGNPFGLTHSVSFGIISAKGRSHMGILDIEDFIQTDAAINPGSSGGPLLNAQGEIIGVNSAIFSQGGGFVGIGFAVPARIAREVVDQLIRNGRVVRGWIGLAAQDMDRELARYFKTPDPDGALVSQITPNGPAEKAQLRPGDVIVRYENTPVRDAGDLKSLVGGSPSGSTAAIEVLREGKSRKVSVKIAEQPLSPDEKLLQKQQAGRAAPGRAGPRLGVAVEDIPAEIARFLKLSAPGGVLVTGVEPGGAAFEAGIEPGDIILSAGRSTVRSAEDFSKAVKELARDEVSVFYVQRGPQEKVFIPVKMSA